MRLLAASVFFSVVYTSILNVCSHDATSTQGPNFNRAYVGVAYGPYVYKDKNTVPTPNDIKTQLAVIRRRFSKITTYTSGGPACILVNGRGCEAAYSVARATAMLNRNRDRGTPKLELNIGLYQFPPLDGPGMRNEVENGFASAIAANRISPGSVEGITFTNEYCRETDKCETVYQLIRNQTYQYWAKANNLKIGVRIDTCGEFMRPMTPGLQNVLRKIARVSNFIQCNAYVTDDDFDGSDKTVQRVVHNVTNFLENIKPYIKRQFPHLEFRVGETGWPSDGEYKGVKGSVRGLVQYWRALARYAMNTKTIVQMFEAFDEPFKAYDYENAPSGEAHFGWWNYNLITRQYDEKIRGL